MYIYASSMTANPPEKKKAECPQFLERITLNNADTRTLCRSAKVEPIIKKIRDVIASGSNILSDDGEISVVIEPGAGNAVFALSVGGLPVLTCCACWSESMSNESWEAADGMFQGLAEINGALDFGYEYRDAPKAPWFATVLLPQFTKISEKHQQEIGALEPCVVFAMWDSERSSLAEE